MGYNIIYTDALSHHGIIGQKWGVRRYQNKDGSYTTEGKERYARGSEKKSISISSNNRSDGMGPAAKKVLIGAGAALTIAGAAYLYSKNKDVIDDAVSNAVKNGKEKVSVLAGKSSDKLKAGKEAVANAAKKAADHTAEKRAAHAEALKKFKDEVKAEKEEKDPLDIRIRRSVRNAAELAKVNFREGVKSGIQEGAKEAPRKAIATVMSGAALLAVKKMLDDSVGTERSAQVFQAANKKKVSNFWKVQPEDMESDREEDEED